VLRYRRARGVERQQLKWFAYAGLVLALVMALAVVFWYRSVLVQVLAALAFNAMPLGRLLPDSSSLAVAAATLAVAAIFQPVRRRIQAAVDRRFNRHRYDAARTIQGFSGRLREEVGLDTLTGELLAVVDQTMQPERTTLWLRDRVSGG
jgi:predicted lysophospholipase L1 biosynthesis ABC-type transport system permease subunit